MLTSKICFIFSIFKVRCDLFFWRFLWHRFWLSLPIFTSLKHRNSLGNEYLPSLLHLLLTDDYLRNFDPNFNGPLFIWLKWFFLEFWVTSCLLYIILQIIIAIQITLHVQFPRYTFVNVNFFIMLKASIFEVSY